jgi:hypothetical protein
VSRLRGIDLLLCRSATQAHYKQSNSTFHAADCIEESSDSLRILSAPKALCVNCCYQAITLMYLLRHAHG